MRRMIYTKLVIDMMTGETLEQEGYWHDGEVAECKGGGGSVESVDYVYNDRMATIAEEQQSWAREYMDMWQKHFKPYEIAQAQTNMELLPLETEVYKNQLSAAKELLPGQTQAAKQFLDASTKGVDVNERMGLVSADASNAWKDVGATMARESARMGVNPNSGRFQGIQAALGTQKAAQMAGARTQARVGAEQENYELLKNAASFNPTGSMLQGVSFMSGGS